MSKVNNKHFSWILIRFKNKETRSMPIDVLLVALALILNKLFTFPISLKSFRTNLWISLFSLGLTGGPLWAAQGSYITCIAMMYAKSAGLKHETVVQIFFSIFFVIYQFNHLGGNLLASLVLKGKGTYVQAIFVLLNTKEDSCTCFLWQKLTNLSQIY